MSRTFLIAEAGVNHNGSFDTALRLVDAAKDAGADAVKFQLFSSKALWGDDRITHLQLSYDQMEDLAAYSKAMGIEFMCTPFDVAAVKALKPIVKRMKVASGCINRVPLLKAVRETGLPVILSTGMSDDQEIESALEHIGSCTLLHCTSSYPCKVEDANLRAIATMRATFFDCLIGYSDHTSGITVPIAAVALGARVLEKHLTLDRNQQGPDHKSSITPKEFKAMRVALDEVEAAMGDGIKQPQTCELKLKAQWHGN